MVGLEPATASVTGGTIRHFDSLIKALPSSACIDLDAPRTEVAGRRAPDRRGASCVAADARVIDSGNRTDGPIRFGEMRGIRERDRPSDHLDRESILRDLRLRADSGPRYRIEQWGRRRLWPLTSCATTWRAANCISLNTIFAKDSSMALLDFIRDAGEKLFHPGGTSSSSPTQPTEPSGSANPQQADAANAKAGDAILNYIKSQNLQATGLTVTYDGATHTASVYGVAPDQETKEKIILCCGNVAGVEHVDDRMSVDQSGSQAKFYVVKSGDTLSKIAKESLGDANQYTKIFEANRPMLKSPDRIYPGQTLRIPAP
jgi:hypothetical protein